MAWFKRSEKNIKSEEHRYMPDGLWTKAPNGNVIYKKELEENLYTDPESDHHFRVSVKEYVEIIFDKGTFKETLQVENSDDSVEK